MAEERTPDLGKVEPIGTWSVDEQPRSGPDAADHGAEGNPIPGTPPAVPLVDSPFEPEPKTSPETDREFDQLRRG